MSNFYNAGVLANEESDPVTARYRAALDRAARGGTRRAACSA